MNINETYQESLNLPYTKFPNKYIDRIEKRLTPAESAICRHIIRNTYGWHRESCKVSNSELAEQTGHTRRGIIKAKENLLNMGLLVKVNARYCIEDGEIKEHKSNTKIGEYRIDLYYDTERSLKRQMEAQLHETDTGSEIVEVPVEYKPEAIEKTQVLLNEIMQHLSQMEDEYDGSPVKEDGHDHCETTSPEQSASELSSPSSIDNIVTKVHNNLKQTKHCPAGSNAKEIKLVRSSFHKLFPDSDRNKEWEFFGYLVKKYGLVLCLDKIAYIREYRKRHVITNPRGLLRSALERNYCPPAFISRKIDADKRSRKEVEKWQEKQEQMKNAHEKHEFRKQKAEEFLGSASPEAKQALTERARAELLEQGSNAMFINDFVINQKLIEIINRDSLACK